MKKILTLGCLLAAAHSWAQTTANKVGIGTTAPIAKLDVVGDTIGLRNTSAWDNLWINVDGTTANINASGADNGMNFKVGSNATGAYGNGQSLSTVMTLLPDGRTGIGTASPDASALLEVRSTTKGMLVPRVSTAQRNAINPVAKGLMVYDSTVQAFYYYNGAWTQVGDNLGNHTATQTINTAGNRISNNGGNNGLLLDNAGNATLTGKVTATGATLTGTGGGAYDYLSLSNGTGDVTVRKGFGAVAINYIISLGGSFPSSGNTEYYSAFVGEIRAYAVAYGGGVPPAGWALCNGQLLQINGNQALYALLGTTYGGNGITNFAVPDLRGAAPIGQGASTAGYNWSIGQRTN